MGVLNKVYVQNINQKNVFKKTVQCKRAAAGLATGAVIFAALGTVSILSLKAIAITIAVLSVTIPIFPVIFFTLAIGFVIGTVICLKIAQEKRSIPPSQQSPQSVLDQVRHLKKSPKDLKKFLLRGNPFENMENSQSIISFFRSIDQVLRQFNPKTASYDRDLEIQEHFKNCLLELYTTFPRDPDNSPLCAILDILFRDLPITLIDVKNYLLHENQLDSFASQWFSTSVFSLRKEYLEICCWYLGSIEELDNTIKNSIQRRIKHINSTIEEMRNIDINEQIEIWQAMVDANTNIYPYLENITLNDYPLFKTEIFDQLNDPR